VSHSWPREVNDGRYRRNTQGAWCASMRLLESAQGLEVGMARLTFYSRVLRLLVLLVLFVAGLGNKGRHCDPRTILRNLRYYRLCESDVDDQPIANARLEAGPREQ